MMLPQWFVYVCIVLNTVLAIMFYVGGFKMFALVSFLSACCFWLNLIARNKIDEYRNFK